MTPKSGFDAAIARAQHMLRLYEFICDTRQRGIRDDWAGSFKSLMHWPQGEEIVRIDGKDRQSMLILRASCGIDRSHFAHDYCSELLRSAIVASVSALDRMLHDLVVKHAWKLLTRKEDEIPAGLKKLSLSALDARKAVEHLRKDAKARPGNLIKKAIQERLHRDFTFQTPDGVLSAANMLGIEDFWGKVATRMPGDPTKQKVIAELRAITTRRNQIVHESDLVLTSRKQPSLRNISYADAEQWIDWMNSFGGVVNDVVEAAV